MFLSGLVELGLRFLFLIENIVCYHTIYPDHGTLPPLLQAMHSTASPHSQAHSPLPFCFLFKKEQDSKKEQSNRKN